MTITIDGKPCLCKPGENLLDVAVRNEVTIPTLCHHGGLPGRGCCRVCIVEAERGGRRNIVTACIYPVEHECAVYTDSERVRRQRGMILALLRARAPESEEVLRLCETYNVPEKERFMVKKGEKCILCGLCADACASLGTGAISTVNRGVDKAVNTPYEEISMACVGCKSCAEVCPTGVITYSQDETSRTIWGKSLPLKKCESCGAVIGTFYELTRAAGAAEADSPSLCERCRKKAITDVMAEAYGR